MATQQKKKNPSKEESSKSDKLTKARNQPVDCAQLSALVQHLSEMIWIIDLDLRIQYTSPSVVTILGYQPEELVGKDGMTMIHPDELGIARLEIEDVIRKTNDRLPTELRLRHAEGYWVPIEIVAENLIDHPDVRGIVLTGRDVRERKKTEQRILVSEKRYRDVVENATEGIAVLQELHPKFFNKKAMEIVGYTYEDEGVSELTLQDIIYPDDFQMAIQGFEKRIKGEPIDERNEFRIVRKDKSIRWIEINAVRIEWEGEPATLNFFNDITEKKLTEEAIAQTERRFQDVIENAGEGIEVLQDGMCKYFNKRISEMTGYSLEELGTMIFEKIIHPEDLEMVVDRYNRRVKGEDLQSNYSFRMIKKNQEIRWVNVSAVLIEWEGRPAVLAFFNDITEQRLADNALKERETQFCQLAEHSPNMIFINCKGKVVYANQMCETILGYSQDELTDPSFNFMNLIAPDSLGTVQQYYEMRQKDQDVPAYEYALLTKDGKRIEAINNAAIIQYQGEEAILGVVTDITEQKLHEKQIESDLKEKEILLKEIHHRVKNNLQVISSLLGLQSRYIADETSLKLIKESQDRVRSIALVHENLYRSPNLVSVDLYKYIRELIYSLIHSYGKQIYLVNTQIDVERIPLSIDFIIPSGLVINELVSNVLKYAFPKSFQGTPSIQIGVRKTEEKQIEIMVKDNGVGFDYNPEREDRETLGLKLVHILAEDQLQGTIQYSNVGGSCFLIQFDGNLKE